MVRARLVTLTQGTVSAAPLATLRATSLTSALLSLGNTTAVTPAASRTAQAGTQIMRVRYAIENQQVMAVPPPQPSPSYRTHWFGPPPHEKRLAVTSQ